MIKHGKKDNLYVGNLNVKRDFGFAPKYVEAIWKMLQQEKADEYIICSGKSVKLLDIVHYVFDQFSLSKDLIVIDKNLFRPGEIDEIYGDNTKAKSVLNWEYNMSFYDVLNILIEEEIQNTTVSDIF